MAMFSGVVKGFSIRQKLLFCFSFILILLAIVVSITFLTISDTQNKVVDVTKKIQPIVISSMQLKSDLKDATSAMGFYLLTQEKNHKQNYINLLSKLDEGTAELKNITAAIGDMRSNELIHAIEIDVQKFKSYKDKLIKLASNFDENYKAVGFASSELSPVNQEMLEIMSNMVVSESEQSLEEERKNLLFAIQELRYSWASVMNFARVFLLYGTPAALDNALVYLEKSKSLLNEIESQSDFLTFEEEDAVPRLVELYDLWRSKFDTVISIRQSDQARADGFLIRTEIGPILSKIDHNLNSLVDLKTTLITDTSEELLSQTTQTLSLVATLLIVGLLLGSSASWLMTNFITRPIRDASAAMNNIAQGEGDLTQRLNESGKDEIGELSNGFNSFVSNIQNLVKNVSAATNKLSNSASDMANVTTIMENAVHQQNQRSEQIESAARELSVSTEQISSSATRTSDAMQNVDSQTKEGKKTIGNALQAINTLGDETSNASGLVKHLSDGIKGIEAIIDLIIGISEQTNLLALNASIEAARAGEQGRGFAVVADEVRTLANRTRESTEEIQNAVESLLKSADDVVNVMSNNNQIAENAITLAAEANNSLDLITNSVAQGAEEATEIANATKQQYQMSVEITELTNKVVEINIATDNVAHKVSTTSNELLELSNQLQNYIKRFNV